MCGSNSKVHTCICMCFSIVLIYLLQDSRRATFHIGNSTYASKLVDLPCIVESQKTLDNKQMFKVADICQVLRIIVCIKHTCSPAVSFRCLLWVTE